MSKLKNKELKTFIRLYKQELHSWQHHEPVPEESSKKIISAFQALSSDDKKYVIVHVLNDLKYAYTSVRLTEQDLELEQYQKKLQIRTKYFVVKMLLIVIAAPLLFIGLSYMLSEIYHYIVNDTSIIEDWKEYYNVFKG